MRETTALGAAIAAGLALGLWRNFADLRDINRAGGSVFEPQLTRAESARRFANWEKAVRMSKGWVGDDSTQDGSDSTYSSELKGNGHHQGKIERDPTFSSVHMISHPAPSISETGTGTAKNNTVKVKTRTVNGDFDFSRGSLFSVSSDLDDADEEDLVLELRKLEIMQKLKKLRKLKLSYY